MAATLTSPNQTKPTAHEEILNTDTYLSSIPGSHPDTPHPVDQTCYKAEGETLYHSPHLETEEASGSDCNVSESSIRATSLGEEDSDDFELVGREHEWSDGASGAISDTDASIDAITDHEKDVEDSVRSIDGAEAEGTGNIRLNFPDPMCQPPSPSSQAESDNEMMGGKNSGIAKKDRNTRGGSRLADFEDATYSFLDDATLLLGDITPSQTISLSVPENHKKTVLDTDSPISSPASPLKKWTVPSDRRQRALHVSQWLSLTRNAHRTSNTPGALLVGTSVLESALIPDIQDKTVPLQQLQAMTTPCRSSDPPCQSSDNEKVGSLARKDRRGAEALKVLCVSPDGKSFRNSADVEAVLEVIRLASESQIALVSLEDFQIGGCNKEDRVLVIIFSTSDGRLLDPPQPLVSLLEGSRHLVLPLRLTRLPWSPPQKTMEMAQIPMLDSISSTSSSMTIIDPRFESDPNSGTPSWRESSSKVPDWDAFLCRGLQSFQGNSVQEQQLSYDDRFIPTVEQFLAVNVDGNLKPALRKLMDDSQIDHVHGPSDQKLLQHTKFSSIFLSNRARSITLHSTLLLFAALVLWKTSATTNYLPSLYIPRVSTKVSTLRVQNASLDENLASTGERAHIQKGSIITWHATGRACHRASQRCDVSLSQEKSLSIAQGRPDKRATKNHHHHPRYYSKSSVSRERIDPSVASGFLSGEAQPSIHRVLHRRTLTKCNLDAPRKYPEQDLGWQSIALVREFHPKLARSRATFSTMRSSYPLNSWGDPMFKIWSNTRARRAFSDYDFLQGVERWHRQSIGALIYLWREDASWPSSTFNQIYSPSKQWWCKHQIKVSEAQWGSLLARCQSGYHKGKFAGSRFAQDGKEFTTRYLPLSRQWFGSISSKPFKYWWYKRQNLMHNGHWKRLRAFGQSGYAKGELLGAQLSQDGKRLMTRYDLLSRKSFDKLTSISTLSLSREDVYQYLPQLTNRKWRKLRIGSKFNVYGRTFSMNNWLTFQGKSLADLRANLRTSVNSHGVARVKRATRGYRKARKHGMQQLKGYGHSDSRRS